MHVGLEFPSIHLLSSNFAVSQYSFSIKSTGHRSISGRDHYLYVQLQLHVHGHVHGHVHVDVGREEWGQVTLYYHFCIQGSM